MREGGSSVGEPFRVHAVRVGRASLGDGTVLFDDDTLVLVVTPGSSGERRLRARLATIDAATLEDDELTIALHDGTRVVVAGDDVGRLRDELLDRCRALPELTRALRAFGSRRGRRSDRATGPDEQRRFFAPLLGARQQASAARAPAAAVRAFDAVELARSLDAALHNFAEQRFAEKGPARRALAAELVDLTEPLRDALTLLDARARDVSAALDDLALWRAWAAQLHVLFEIADRVWIALDVALDVTPRPPRPAKRRRPGWKLGGCILLAGLLGTARALAAQHRTLLVGMRADSLRADGFDVVEVRSEGTVIVANPNDEQRLRAHAWRVSPILTPSAARAGAPSAPRVYRPFDDKTRGVRVFLDSLARANSLVHVDSIGATFEGRPLLAVKIGPADDSPSRPNVIIMATYHAREWIATEMALRLLRYLATTQSARVDSMVRGRDLWIIPVVNPDGYQYTFDRDRLWRKNRHPVSADQTGPGVGVDLNRNHSEKWGFDNVGSFPAAVSEIYRGPSPASELETQAIERFHRAHPPVTSLSYHSYAELILFPPGYQYGLLPGDLSIYRALAGNDAHPAALDHLPSAPLTKYRSVDSWNLYPTNGEYTDWAYAQLGTIAYTQELTNGFDTGIYYGFEFPDDETRIETVFQDNLPFALDLIDAARDPLHALPKATGLTVDPLVLESVTPVLRVRTVGQTAPSVRSDAGLSLTPDTVAHGTFMRRWLSAPTSRQTRVTVEGAGARTAFEVLATGGAEPQDTGWVTSLMSVTTGGVAGTREWRGSQGYVRSPVVHVPATIDTLSILFWTRYDGAGATPHGEVRLSTDGGTTFSEVGRVAGDAQVYYPERVVAGGVRGKMVSVEFSSPDGLPWRLDEITIVGHSPLSQVVADTTSLRPSANPLRGDVVYFNWPYATSAGELRAYDFTGRLAWHVAVGAGTITVPWNVRDSRIVNGVYLVVARAETGGQPKTFKLFVTRPP